jgi:hypothetical protein
MDADAVQTMVQQLVQQQVQQQMQQLQQQAAQAAKQAAKHAPATAAAAAAAAVPAIPVGPRMPAPATFEGRAAALDEWIADINQQIAWYAMGEAAAIRFACGFLRGAARDWLAGLGAVPDTWAQLQGALRARFQPVNSADTARGKLLALSQGKQSVHEYVDAFRRLLIRVPSMSDDDRLYQFIRGLRSSIGVQLRVQGVATLHDAIAMAARIGGISDAQQQGGAASSSSAPMELDALAGIEGLEADTSAAANAPITRAELQQLLNAIREGHRGTSASSCSSSSSSSSNRNGNGRYVPRGLPTVPHLTSDQVREYMEAGKCFGCGSKDHRGRQCPKRIVGADGRVSWSK